MSEDLDTKQVGGTHYKSAGTYEPFKIIRHYKMGFFWGNALKYLLRYKNKGGKQDLEKCIHYIQEIIADEYPETKGGK
jgi:hypothetical protein